MKLNDAEFKRFKELAAKVKAGKATTSEQSEFDELAAKKNTKGSNDLQWWKNYPTLLQNATNFPFNYRGADDISLSVDNNVTKTPVTYHVPGLAIIRVLTSIGYSTKASDAYNAQTRQLWLDMHRKYRGMGGYQKSDLGIMILAIQELFTTIAEAERIYAVCNTYEIQNKNVPYTLFEGLGIDPSIQASLADFRYGLNYRIAQAKQLCLPKGIAAFDASRVNFLNLFKDSENPRASLFGFVKDEFGFYDATGLSTGGSIKFVKANALQKGSTPIGGFSAWTMADIFNVIDGMLAALLDDDDVAKMCSDLIAAYGPENVEVIAEVPELLMIQPVHDYERKLQFHNLTIVGECYTRYHGDIISDAQADARVNSDHNYHTIYQKNNVIVDRLVPIGNLGFHGYIAVDNNPYADLVPEIQKAANGGNPKASETLFDCWVDNPGEMEIACGTRFTSVASDPEGFTKGGTDYVTRTLIACPLSPVTQVSIYTYVDQNNMNNFYIDASVQYSGDFSDYDYAEMSKFDWFPLLYIDKVPGISVFGDLDNFTVIKAEDLNKLHEVCALSAYKIPVVSYMK